MSDGETKLDEFIEENGHQTDNAKRENTLRIGPFNYSIPDNWETSSLLDACVNRDGDRVPVKKTKREDMVGDIPYYGATGQIDTVDDFLFDEQLLLLAEDGANLLTRNSPITYVIDGKSWVNNHAHVLKPKEGYNIWYLADFLEYLKYEPFVTGTAQPKLTQDSMGFLRVPRPPLTEQRKIASVLYNVDEAIRKTEEIIEQTKRVKKGITQEVMRSGVEDHELKEIKVPMLPEKWEIPVDWELEFLEDLTHDITDGAHQTPTYVEEGVPFLKVEDIQEANINWQDVSRIPEEEHEDLTKRSQPEKDDILLSKNGTIGITKLIDWEREFSHFVSLCLIKPNQEKIYPKFLSLIIGSEICMHQAKVRSKKNTVTNLHLEEIKRFSIPLPPIEEQKRIAEILQIAEDRIENEEEQRNQLHRLKRALMQDLLTGDVRTADRDIDVLPEVEAHG